MFVMHIPFLWILMSTICAGVNILMPLNNEVNNEVHEDISTGWGWGCDTGLCCFNDACGTDEFCFGGDNFTSSGLPGYYCRCGTNFLFSAKWHGTCKKKVADNEYCGFRNMLTEDHSVCQSNHCVCNAYDADFMTPAIYGIPEKKPYDSCWCRGEDGFPEGHSCSVTADCDMSNNLYCAGASAESVGKCSPCPSYCADQRESCYACSSSPNILQCGQQSYWDSSVCYLNNLGGGLGVFGYLSNYIDCFGEQYLSDCIMTSYVNNKEEIKKCLGGEDCTIKIGDGCFSWNKNYNGKHKLYNSSLLGMEEEQVAKLSQEQWGEISNRRWAHKFVFSEEDNMAYDDVTIGREESFLELNDDDCNPSFFSKITSDGTIALSGGLVFEINPRTTKVVVNYNIDLDIHASISIIGGIDKDTGHCSKEIPLANLQNMYSQVFMLGTFPLAIQLDMQPYAWVKLDLTGSVKGQVDVTKKVNVQGSISFDGLLKTINMADPIVTEEPLSITPRLKGDARLSFTARVGPKLTLSINTIPTELDLAAAAHLDMDFSFEAEESRFCLAGSASMAASIDAKVSVKFLPNPVDALYATCLQSAKFIGAAGCLGRAIIGQSGTHERNAVKELCEQFKEQMDIVTDDISCMLHVLTRGTDWVVMPLAALTIGGEWCSDSETSTFKMPSNTYVSATPECL